MEQPETYNLLSEVTDFVDEFKLSFQGRFNATPTVYFNLPGGASSKPTMALIESIVNKILEADFPEKFPDGIRTAGRKGGMVFYRHMFFQICAEYKYTCELTGKYLGGYDHATVIYGKKRIQGLLEVRDRNAMAVYETIKGEIDICFFSKKINSIENILDKARRYALVCHTETNHLYDGRPYMVHLNMVVSAAARFSGLIPSDKMEIVFAGCLVHDIIEDTRQTYNDVKKVLGEEVAELAYALTNDKGKNREERAGFKYYAGLKAVPFADFIKICDRIANAEYSKQASDNRMFVRYKEELPDFTKKLYKAEYKPMFDYLKTLLK